MHHTLRKGETQRLIACYLRYHEHAPWPDAQSRHIYLQGAKTKPHTFNNVTHTRAKQNEKK